MTTRARQVPLRIVAVRCLDSAMFCRETDEQAGRATEGWRTVENYATAAGRGVAYVPAEDARRCLDELVEDDLLEHDRIRDVYRLVDRAPRA